MAEADVPDMSLDDIIKAKPSLVKGSRRGGKGRGGGGGGRGAGRGGGRGRGGGFRQSPYSRDTPAGRWTHDRFEGGGSARRDMGGRMGGGGRKVAKLLISNLEFSVNDQDIRELFGEFGAIKSYSVHYDRSGRSLGTADVTYHDSAHCVQAIKTYNDVPLDGKPMKIEMVTDEGPRGGVGDGRPSGRPYTFGGDSRPRGRNSFGSGGRGNGGGRGRGFGGRGGRREDKKPVTAEELDKQLDEYKKTKA